MSDFGKLISADSGRGAGRIAPEQGRMSQSDLTGKG